MTDEERPGFRVYIDGTPLRATGVRAVLVLATGEVCEVQVTRLGPELVVALGGDHDAKGLHVTREGVLMIHVAPTAKG